MALRMLCAYSIGAPILKPDTGLIPMEKHYCSLSFDGNINTVIFHFDCFDLFLRNCVHYAKRISLIIK